MLKPVILHHHFRPGSVRRVIEIATPRLIAHWPERVRGVVLAIGEAPDSGWLGAFRKRFQGTPVKVVVQPAFGCVSELPSNRWSLRRCLMENCVLRTSTVSHGTPVHEHSRCYL